VRPVPAGIAHPAPTPPPAHHGPRPSPSGGPRPATPAIHPSGPRPNPPAPHAHTPHPAGPSRPPVPRRIAWRKRGR
jgi:hypothetical protein